MAVYSTMIRDDPDSRARLRVTPEQALNFPNYYCLASWIANGTRAPSFMGQTYPLPDVGEEWAERAPRRAGQTRRPLPRAARIDARHRAAPAATGEPAGAAEDISAPRAATGIRGRRASTERTASAVSQARPNARCRSTTSDRRRRRRPRRQPRPPDRRRRDPEPARPTGDRPASRHAARARVPRPDQRDRRRRPARRRQRACHGSTTRTTRSSRCSTALGSRPQPDRPGRAARPRAPHASTTGWSSSTATASSPATPPGLREHATHRRQAAAALLADAARPPGRPGTQAGAGDLAEARMAGDRAAARRTARARPTRARLGDRVPPRRRRPRDRPLAHPALRHRPLPSPPSRLRASAGTRSRSTRSRSPTGRRSSTSSSRRSPRSSPTCRSSCASSR